METTISNNSETINYDCYVVTPDSPQWFDDTEHADALYYQPDPEIIVTTPNYPNPVDNLAIQINDNESITQETEAKQVTVKAAKTKKTNSTADTSFSETLFQGLKNDKVIFLQKCLNNIEQKNSQTPDLLEENGLFGTKTVEKVLALQAKWGMAGTGEVDEEFWRRMLTENA